MIRNALICIICHQALIGSNEFQLSQTAVDLFVDFPNCQILYSNDGINRYNQIRYIWDIWDTFPWIEVCKTSFDRQIDLE